MTTMQWDADGQRWVAERRSGADRRRLLDRAVRAAALVLAAVAAIVLAIGGLLLGFRDDTARSSASPSASGYPTDSSTPTWDSGAAGQSQLPAGVHLISDDAGFDVAVPDGWTRTVTSPQGVPVVRYAESDSDQSAYLEIYPVSETGYTPYDALWQTDRTLSGQYSGYQRIELTQTDDGGGVLEYRIVRSDGSISHTLARGLVAGNEQPYVVLVSGPDDRWGSAFTAVATAADDSFCVTGYCSARPSDSAWQ